MSEKNFTPGPWKVLNPYFDVLVINSLEEPIVCELSTDGKGVGPIKDNANLISAAPDLYAAAELVLSVFNDFSPSGNRIDIPPLREALTKALSKARGENA